MGFFFDRLKIIKDVVPSAWAEARIRVKTFYLCYLILLGFIKSECLLFVVLMN